MHLSLISRFLYALVGVLSLAFTYLYAVQPRKIAILQTGDVTGLSDTAEVWGRHIAALMGAYGAMLMTVAILGTSNGPVTLYSVVYEALAWLNYETTGTVTSVTRNAHRARAFLTLAVAVYECCLKPTPKRAKSK